MRKCLDKEAVSCRIHAQGVAREQRSGVLETQALLAGLLIGPSTRQMHETLPRCRNRFMISRSILAMFRSDRRTSATEHKQTSLRSFFFQTLESSSRITIRELPEEPEHNLSLSKYRSALPTPYEDFPAAVVLPPVLERFLGSLAVHNTMQIKDQVPVTLAAAAGRTVTSPSTFTASIFS